jgi:hypothetical protein
MMDATGFTCFRMERQMEWKKLLIFVNAEDMEGSGPEMFKRNIAYDHLEMLRECTRNLNQYPAFRSK